MTNVTEKSQNKKQKDGREKQKETPEEARIRKELEEKRKAQRAADMSKAHHEGPEREKLTILIIERKKQLDQTNFGTKEATKDALLRKPINVFTSPIEELRKYKDELYEFS